MNNNLGKYQNKINLIREIVDIWGNKILYDAIRIRFDALNSKIVALSKHKIKN